MAVRKEIVRSGWSGVGGIFLVAAAVLLTLSLVSYTPGDIPALRVPPNEPPVNLIGPLGAWTAYGLFMTLGISAGLIPLLFTGLAIWLLWAREGRVWPKALWLTAGLLAASFILELRPGPWAGLVPRLNLGSAGGLVGHGIGRRLLAVRVLGEVGTLILAWAILAASLFFAFESHPAHVFGRLRGPVRRWFDRLRERLRSLWRARMDRRAQMEQEARDLARQRRRLERALRNTSPSESGPTPVPEKAASVSEPPPPTEPPPEPTPVRAAQTKRKQPVSSAEPPSPVPADSPVWSLPPLRILAPIPPASQRVIRNDLQDSARILTETLSEFGIDAHVTNVETGPVVTRYQVLPAPGVRVERISALSNNIALTMKAESVRVQAPIPGKGVVGIEVPNSKSTIVTLREVVESESWPVPPKEIPLALGKDVAGRVITADLSEMPHLLIAGATGSGKTVCMNSLLTGMLMAKTPDQLRLLLVDPKIVEFSAYNNLPHLVVPVITDPKKVALGLRWAIAEMESRYKLFAKVGVRNISGFNNRPIVKQADLFGGEPQAQGAAKGIPDRLPYLVIVVDELADLMLVAQADIENSIARLAQLSRAVGIHMILATQRPSVNVITGTIKANFPGRIAFQVAQRTDSRTILDANGADKLLGKGDLLFLPPGTGKLVRAQGCFTTDAEVHGVTDHWREQGEPRFEAAIQEKIEKKGTEVPDLDEDDELIEAAVEIIRQTQRASTSSLQRRLRIGYTRAARIMDILEEKGIVGPAQGSDPRDILIDLDGDIPDRPCEESTNEAS